MNKVVWAAGWKVLRSSCGVGSRQGEVLESLLYRVGFKSYFGCVVSVEGKLPTVLSCGFSTCKKIVMGRCSPLFFLLLPL